METKSGGRTKYRETLHITCPCLLFALLIVLGFLLPILRSQCARGGARSSGAHALDTRVPPRKKCLLVRAAGQYLLNTTPTGRCCVCAFPLGFCCVGMASRASPLTFPRKLLHETYWKLCINALARIRNITVPIHVDVNVNVNENVNAHAKVKIPITL